MLKYVQLQQHFDAEKMKAEVTLLEASHWKQHYNKRHYEGEWTVLPLRSINGQPENIISVHSSSSGAGTYCDTALLQACPYLQSVLAFFQCEKRAVRLMKLHAGAVINEHHDMEMNYEEGEARLHIPVVTNPQVAFYLDKEKLHLEEGECWYLNLSLRHSVRNNGPADRIHLVIDCKVNNWLREMLTGQVLVQKQVEAEKDPDIDLASKRKIIQELRLMNTPTSLELAAKLENEL